MRSYGQFCAVAKALDVIGDRWTLLIVRELLLAGPSRYTDLRSGLPGIATNLLADRLRQLEAAGLLAREEAPPPVASTLFSLTPRGEQLRGVLDALGAWGVEYMAEGPAPGDAFRGRWLAWPVERFLRDSQPDGQPVSLELQTGEAPLLVEAGGGEITARPGPGTEPDVVLSGEPYPILGLLSGRIGLAEARRRGVRLQGDAAVLARLAPAAA